jgi:hypothetical protein
MTANEAAIRKAYRVAEDKDVAGFINCFTASGAFAEASPNSSRVRCVRHQSPASLLPAAAERAVDLHDREQLVQLRLREHELRREEPRVGVEHFEVV